MEKVTKLKLGEKLRSALAGLTIAGVIIGANYILQNREGQIVHCDIEIPHMHKYVTDEGFVGYFENEEKTFYGLHRTDEYISIEGRTKEEKTINNIERDNGFVKIEDNIEELTKIEENFKKHTDYTGIHLSLEDGSYYAGIEDYFTKYTAYSIEKVENGYELRENDDLDSLIENKDKYPYIKREYKKEMVTKRGQTEEVKQK